MPNLLVAVDGATGYLGNHLVAQLRGNGIDVRCIVHPGAKQRDVDFLKSLGAEVVVASLEGGSQNNAQLTRALAGADVAVHLIGSIAPPKGQNLANLHTQQTANLVTAAKHAGVKKIVQVTALGTDEHAISQYHQTKWQAEQQVRNSGLAYVILRPSLIIGRTVGHRNSKLIARYMDLIAKRPSVPVIGNGSNRLQPVFVGDLAKALEQAIVTSRFDNGIFEIGGDEILSMRQIVEKLMALQQVTKRIAGVSPTAAGFLARICETVQRVPTLSRDQIKLSMNDNICSDNALRKVFNIEPTKVDDSLATYSSSHSGGLLESSGNRR